MKVKTDYEGSKIFTVGKEYIITRMESRFAFRIRDDFGEERFCLFAGCSHLNGDDWIVVDETTEVAPVAEQFKTETISLRDHFAGLAMQGYLSNSWQAKEMDETGDSSSEQMTLVAEAAYYMADAMLKARGE